MCLDSMSYVRLDRYAPEMELVKHAIDYSQRDVEGAVEVSLYKVRSSSVRVLHLHAVDYCSHPAEILKYICPRLNFCLDTKKITDERERI